MLRTARYTVDWKQRRRAPSHDNTCMTILSRIAVAAATAIGLAGCAVPTQTARLTDGPDPVTLRLSPAVPTRRPAAPAHGPGPHADSIVFESENGLDRYWGQGDVLRVRLALGFRRLAATAASPSAGTGSCCPV